MFYAQDHAQNGFFNFKLYSYTQLKHVSDILLSSFLCACVSGECSPGGRPVCWSEVDRSNVFLSPSPQFLRHGVSLTLELAVLAMVVWHQALVICLSLPTPALGFQAEVSTTGFYSQHFLYYINKFNLLQIK